MICSRCIYDDRIPFIKFDEEGLCNYCKQQDQLEIDYPNDQRGTNKLEELAAEIKKAGRGKKYDVIIGVSGGADSSYLCWLAKELGLRPLAAHFDNTWNSKIAVENISNVLGKLNIDLYTHVVDNQEFCDLMKSFMKASVPDIDTPSDIGLATTHYMAAKKFGVKYIFQGHAFRTEGISPQGWFYMDARYIAAVHKQFGSMKMKTFPNLLLRKWLWWSGINRIKIIRPLYWVNYNKEECKKFLSENFGWKWYGGHHMENRTAYFTNNYYLPRKFGIDLRFCEYSALVRNGQMTREQALAKIQEPKPFDKSILEEVKKRLNLSNEEFEKLMELPIKTYQDYPTHKQTFERLKPLFWLMASLNLVPKSFYLKYTLKYDNLLLPIQMGYKSPLVEGVNDNPANNGTSANGATTVDSNIVYNEAVN